MAASATSIRLRNRRHPLLWLMLRFPLWLYRTPLRFLMGRWYVMVVHRGRKSGKVYRTLLDVKHIDKATGEIFVSSGWGERADWWRNICATPALAITIGSKTFTPEQRFVDGGEAYELRKRAWKRHPLRSRVSLVTTNYPTPKIDKDFKKWARDMPFVGFRPPTSVEH